MADTIPITRLTIKDTETGAETPVDVKTCARGVTCNEGKTVQDHIDTLAAHVGNAGLHMQVQIGGNEPDTGPVLWFDTAGYEQSETTEDAVLSLAYTEDDSGVTAVVDGADYSVQNASVDGNPTGQKYDFNIL